MEKAPLNNRVFCMGDTPLWLDIAKQSKFYYLGTITCVYRQLKESARQDDVNNYSWPSPDGFN
ncbi:MAG: hypothetical protein ACOX1Z_02190 [Candidatus Ratteibacteria bacterium]